MHLSYPSVTITRRPDPIQVDGLSIANLQQLRASIAPLQPISSPATPPTLLFADLSLGAWFGHMLAQQLCLQLGIPGPTRPSAQGSRTAWDDVAGYSDEIGVLIDAESNGDQVITTTLALAQQILAAIAQRPALTLVVLAPRFGLAWQRENELLIEFLYHGLQQTPSRLVVAFAAAEPPQIPPRWQIRWLDEAAAAAPLAPPTGLWSLVPGILDAELAALLIEPEQAALLEQQRLAGGGILVPPEWRQSPDRVPMTSYDQLAERVASIGWLKAYAHLYGDPQQADVDRLRQETSLRFAEGSHDIAFQLIERALRCARDTIEAGAVMLQAQSMRIALMRFAEAAQAPAPAVELPADLRGALCQCKAWGLVMINRSDEAEPYFQQARDLLKDYEQSRYYLYLLNISALNKLRLGQIDQALELEQRIERQIADVGKTDWHLQYINFINLARLYRKMGDFARAEQYYTRAFATHDNLRSDSDLVYINVCLAHLNMERQQHGAAFICWLRAALHYVSSAVPEALAPRVARAITEQAPPTDITGPETVAAALRAWLQQTGEAAGINPVVFAQQPMELPPTTPVPVFVRTEELPLSEQTAAFGSHGWSVLGLPDLVVPPAYRGPQYDQLCRLLYALIEESCPPFTQLHAQTIAIDTRYGREMAISALELLYSCIRLGVKHVWFAGKTLTLTPELIHDVTQKSLVSLSAGLAYARFVGPNLCVYFKRYREPVLLSIEQSKLVSLIDTGKTVGDILAAAQDIGSAADIMAALRSLERSRVVTISAPSS